MKERHEICERERKMLTNLSIDKKEEFEYKYKELFSSEVNLSFQTL